MANRIQRLLDWLCCAGLHGLVRLSVPLLRVRARWRRRRAVLFAGQAYYNAWYLSRGLREHGWRADVLNWDTNEASQMYYHGEDFRFTADTPLRRQLLLYLVALWRYDVFHFSNAYGISFGDQLRGWFARSSRKSVEIALLKRAGKRVVYSNNGCLDGVSQTSFRKWGDVPICNVCRWRNVPEVCSDERNLAWGKFRNAVADFQCLTGGNRVDYNVDPTVHEVPEFYCLDPEVWHPRLEIPEEFKLAFPAGAIKLYHAVGNFASRTDSGGVNIKSTHIYVPLVEKLKREGIPAEIMFFSNVPNKQLRFYQVQADIVLDMLTYGFFGATAREAMMLGKPVICYLRPEWLESMRREIPEYVDELPIVRATPETVETKLRALIEDPEQRERIGRRSRAFAVKWHSSAAGARRLGQIYSKLLRQEAFVR